MFITVELLRARNACRGQCELFARLFPEGAEVTEEACIAVAARFDWNWGARHLLPLTKCADYRTKRGALDANYNAKGGALDANYNAKCDALLADYTAADYRTKRAALEASYEAKSAALLADHSAKRAALEVDYEVKCARLFARLAMEE